MKDKKMYRCPECGAPLHQIGTPKKQRCTNPSCKVVIVCNPEPVKGPLIK